MNWGLNNKFCFENVKHNDGLKISFNLILISVNLIWIQSGSQSSKFLTTELILSLFVMFFDAINSDLEAKTRRETKKWVIALKIQNQIFLQLLKSLVSKQYFFFNFLINDRHPSEREMLWGNASLPVTYPGLKAWANQSGLTRNELLFVIFANILLVWLR